MSDPRTLASQAEQELLSFVPTDPLTLEHLARAEAHIEAIRQCSGFDTSLPLQVAYSDALFGLFRAWQKLIQCTYPPSAEYARKAHSLVKQIKQLPLLENEPILVPWMGELARLWYDLPERLPQLPEFARSGALQSHYAAHLASAASRAWTASDAFEKLTPILGLPLFGHWPDLAHSLVLGLSHVLRRATLEDQPLVLQAVRLLEEHSANPAPALRGWDVLLHLEPGHPPYLEGRGQWLARFGFPQNATLDQVVRGIRQPL